jgi:hypothetical protein
LNSHLVRLDLRGSKIFQKNEARLPRHGPCYVSNIHLVVIARFVMGDDQRSSVSEDFMDETTKRTARTNNPAANPDPITKAPGSHPIGTGIGAAAGGVAGVGGAAAAGAAVGSAVGPVGTVVGAAVGAVAGGLIGKGISESVNPSVEHDYWRSNFASRPYATPGSTYDEYAPAYQYGWESRGRHPGRSFDEVEGSLSKSWNSAKGKSKLEWNQAKAAVRDAWNRVDSDDT